MDNMRIGCKKDKFDERDYKYEISWISYLWINIQFLFYSVFSKTYDSIKITPQVDLRKSMPPIYDQGNLGSCTANAIGATDHYRMIIDKKIAFMPSRLFIYYNERAIEGTIDKDSGASLRDGIKTLAKQGVCPEAMWPYNVPAFKDKPSQICYTEALKHQAIKYQRINGTSLTSLKYCLQKGNPIVFGFNVYESFYSIGKNGIMPLPKSNEVCDGGHAVVIVGYDDKNKMFVVRNSWGSSWGDNGYFYMPYSFATSGECHDFWVITTIE